MGGIRGSAPPGASLRLVPADGSAGPVNTRADRSGRFEFVEVAAGWYILSTLAPNLRELAQAVHVASGTVELAAIHPPKAPTPRVSEVAIVTVCEAIAQRDALDYRRAVIVGIFKSGLDETLRLDCPTELRSGEIGWPSSIGLTGPVQAPDQFRAEVQKKREVVLNSGPAGAHPRPERVVGLYGMFVSLSGLTDSRCCTALVETMHPPARLFGIPETDLRVLR